MRLTNLKKRYIKLVLTITLLTVLALVVSGCEDLGFPPPQSSEPEGKTEVEATPVAIKTDDIAILAVYEHLLSQAESYQAKVYLADFYTVGDKWSANLELLKDGTGIWYVIVDMRGTEPWEERPYWQQACWLVYEEGEVKPSNRFQANALRIEADLQELSLQPGVAQGGGSGE